LNDKDYIERTIQSVLNQSYNELEYIIVDGCSVDDTLNVIQKYKNKISNVIIETDNGIYDAMNKGLRAASGDWVLFMNCRDTFADNDVLDRIFSKLYDTDFIYSDTLMSDGELAVCDIDANRIIHQSLIYKRAIHDEVGFYVSKAGFTAADYLFFQLAKHKKWVKTDVVISIFEKGSYSSRIDHFKQKIAIDIMFGNVNKYFGCAIIVFHPIYNFIKKHIVRCKKFLSA
jgi:glycosyltransferase involved in cell wall biosynthesis